jgi:hypothetical protein
MLGALYPHVDRVRVFALKERMSLNRKTDSSDGRKLVPTWDAAPTR